MSTVLWRLTPRKTLPQRFTSLKISLQKWERAPEPLNGAAPPCPLRRRWNPTWMRWCAKSIRLDSSAHSSLTRRPRQEDHCHIPRTEAPTSSCCLNQPGDLGFSQVLPRPYHSVGLPPGRECPIYGDLPPCPRGPMGFLNMTRPSAHHSLELIARKRASRACGPLVAELLAGGSADTDAHCKANEARQLTPNFRRRSARAFSP